MTNTILYTMKSIASILAFYFLFSVSGFAGDDQSGYCQHAETTADILECIGVRYKAEEAKMTALYEAIINQDNVIENFESNQVKWVSHRDESCAIEGSIYKGGSLERVQELDCRARMTANRVKHFEIIAEAYDETQIPEFANPPRWVNVLVRDYPNIFWGFGSGQSTDTDCDGVNENIVRGIDDNHKMILAIADSQQTGRPKITVLNFDDQKNCQIRPEITIEKLPEPKPENSSTLKCVQKLKIQTKSCGDFSIQYNNADKTYKIMK